MRLRKLLRGVVAGTALALALAACTTEPDTAPQEGADGPKNGDTYVFGNIAYT
ncbi:hypothetical protein [Tessaracoccus flavescens]|uniref:hypothetical protein n=1 Tax=Tessaracoccus flavescens TaxID=399497 RepID=UPI0013747BD2|nr:hypothetical protein [Tessaracoccus flavescens]